MPDDRSRVEPEEVSCHAHRSAGAGAEDFPFPRQKSGAGVVSPLDESVQLCQRCGQFVATLMVRPDRFLVCEACALEADIRERAIPVRQFTRASDCVRIEREWITAVAAKLRAIELRAYLWIAASDSPVGRPELARLLGTSRSGIKRAMLNLTAAGLVHRVSCGQSGTRYLIVRSTPDGDRVVLVRPDVYSRPVVQNTASESNGRQRGGSTGEPPYGLGGSTGEPPSGGSDGSGQRGSPSYALPVGRRKSLPTGNDPGGVSRVNPPPTIPVNPPRPSGRLTHPPTPEGRSSPVGSHSIDLSERSSPVGSHSSDDRSAVDGSAPAEWPGYRRHVVESVRRRLFGYAEAAGVEATDEHVDEFITLGTSQRWLVKQADRGKVGSPLHTWCMRDRWLGWLAKRQGRTRATCERARVDAVRRASKQVRLEIARQAGELAAGRGPSTGKGK